MGTFLADERGDTSAGIAIGAALVLLVVILWIVMGGLSPQQQQPGIDVRVGT